MRILFHPANPGHGTNSAKIETKASLPLQSVATLDQAKAQISASSTNVGNMIHNEAVSKTFEFDLNRSCMAFIERVYEKECSGNRNRFQSLLSNHFDMVVFSFANLIARPLPGAERQQADHMASLCEIVRSINVPLVVLGMGMQSELEHESDLQPELVQFLREIDERAVIFGVRGPETLKFLHAIGCSNARALGCPSLYVYPDNVRRITAPARISGADILTAGYLDRRRLLGYQPERLLFLRNLASKFQAGYVFQNDLYTLHELQSIDGLYNDADGRCDPDILNAYFGSFGHDEAFSDYRFFRDPRAWRQYAASKDFYVGDRFHGGVVSLQVGKPALFLWNDLRVRELTGNCDIPSLSLEEFNSSEPAEAIAQALASERLERMKETYEARLADYMSVAAQVGLRPLANHESQPVSKRFVTVDGQTDEDLPELSDDPPRVRAARRLFDLSGRNFQASEALLNVLAKGANESSLVAFLNELLAGEPDPSEFNEQFAVRVGRALRREQAFLPCVILLTAFCDTHKETWSLAVGELLFEALAHTGRGQEAKILFETLKLSKGLPAKSEARFLKLRKKMALW